LGLLGHDRVGRVVAVLNAASRFKQITKEFQSVHVANNTSITDGVDARLLDLRDFPMPFFDQPVTPATPGRPAFENEVVQRWTAAIAQSDDFVFVTPEYDLLRCSRTPSTGFI